MGQINIDYVVCPFCFSKLKTINNKHLKMHGLTKEQFLNKFPNQKLMCENTLKQTRVTGKSWNLSEETKQKQSESKIGNKNPFFGKKPWNNGIPQSEKTKEKNRISHLGKKASFETRQKMSESAKIAQNRPEVNLKRSNSLKNKPKSNEAKIKYRLKALERIEFSKGQICPNFNKKSIEIFKSFDEINGTKGQYAGENNKEYKIKELGYFVDYINFEKKLIIEVDEKHHKKQKEKDKQRQKEIQSLYSDFTFLRFEEFEMNKILELKI